MSVTDALVKAANSRDPDALRRELAALDDGDPAAVPILTQLLLEDWHDSHEDIVFMLGLIGDPRAIDAIAKAVVIPFDHLVQWGNVHPFQRKCAYALARIATPESKTALEKLSMSPDPMLKQYGEEGLQHWPLPYRRTSAKIGIGVAVCPGCRKRLTFGDRLSLTARFYTPWYCPRCGQAFVNAPWATITSGLLAALFMAASVFFLAPLVAKDVLLPILVGLAVLFVPISVLIMRPIPYAALRLYGKRERWQSVLLFGALPLAIISLAIYLLFRFKVGL